jgi:beta-glucosidase
MQPPCNVFKVFCARLLACTHVDLASCCHPFKVINSANTFPVCLLPARYEEDVQLAAKAGCNAFRLSIEWARIEPRKGEIDMEAVARCAL